MIQVLFKRYCSFHDLKMQKDRLKIIWLSINRQNESLKRWLKMLVALGGYAYLLFEVKRCIENY